jgi:hypothetical protein
MTNIVSDESRIFITKHAKARMQQRSFSKSDISTIRRCGTVITDHEILLTEKDVDREACDLRARIKQLQRHAERVKIWPCGTNVENSANELHANITHYRRQIILLERLRNRKIVIDGNCLITCYLCTKSELKRISRILN